MTKAQKISETLIAEIVKAGSVRAGFDAVMGAGAFDKLAGEIYDELRNEEVRS